ncbi:YicC/YloC family endoribonuclease [Bacillus sp. E214]|uniref:YicC/YloC family endoribonuclease n=2 Tax=unclassified Bacillus (in: firmicutes) TaxID=185979 RepID=UPI0021CCE5AF|nr:YicC/YloC family endoribonuclease [Bacillus sp. E214]
MYNVTDWSWGRMILSMTGYGRAKTENDSLSITIEMKSVNHRFFECSIRSPRQLLMYEDRIKKIIQQKLHRGRIEVFISLQGEGTVKRTMTPNWDLIDQFMNISTEFNNKYSAFAEPEMTDLLHLEHIISIDEKEEVNADLEKMLLGTVEKAASRLSNMRETEGEFLKSDLTEHIKKFDAEVEDVRERAPEVVKQYSSRLKQKLEEAVGDIFDPNRLLTEIALFTDKADIHEEVSRLKSHIAQFLESLEASGPIGRKLDFLIQEMNRETNTIGSKANDAIIARKVVEMKTILEKMKEQVQNVE